MRSAPLLIAALALLGGCHYGPAAKESGLPVPEAFFAGESELYSSETVGTDVWRSFDDPQLLELLERALESNRDIAQALARLERSQVLRSYQPFSWFPTVTASGGSEQSRQSNNDPMAFDQGGIQESVNLGLEASWEIDLFGSLRNQFRVIDRNVEASRASLEAVRIAVVAEVAQGYFTLRGLQAQRAVQQRNLENLSESVRVFEARLEAGRGSGLELAQIRALAAQVQAALPQIDDAIDRQINRLATLTATSIEAVHAELGPAKPLPAMPELVAVGTPQEWLQRRPDVREAERRLAAAGAQIGVEVADYFPRIDLVGSFGWTAATAGTLLDSNSERWRWGPVLSWRFLDFGRVRLEVREAQFIADEAFARYEQTLLLALEDTENALSGLRRATERLVALTEARDQGDEALRLARLRYDEGAIDYLQLLDAERTALQIHDAHAIAVTARAVALTTVYRALAGDFASVATGS